MLKKLKYLTVVLIISSIDIYSQNAIDSIKNIIDDLDNSKKAEAYNDLAYEYSAINELDLAEESADKALSFSVKAKDIKQQANALNTLGLINMFKGNLDEAETKIEKSIALGREIENPTILANAYNYLGNIHYSKSNYQKALKSWEESLNNFNKLNDKQSSAQILQFIGVIYKNWSEYNNAIEYYEKALEIYKELKDEIGMAKIYANLGNIYYYSNIDYDNALDNYQKAMTVFSEMGKKAEMAQIMNSIGLVYTKKSLISDALHYFEECLKISEEIESDYLKAQALTNIGDIYHSNKNYEKALKNLNEALDIFSASESKKDIAINLSAIGSLYHSWGKNDLAKDYYQKSIELCKELNLKKELSDNYKMLAYVLFDLKDFKSAFKYHELFAQQNDSIFSTEYRDMITEWNARLETAENEAKFREQKMKLESELRRKNLIVYSSIAGILTVLIFSALLYKQFREKQKANILLRDQNEEIKSQRDKIFEQNKEITDSIEYASKIQSAMLPPDDYISKILPEHFVLYRPRDIVSGDFYWLNKYSNKVYLCAADCTGHGVPGAFMSMLGIALLNEIINKKEKFTAADILNNLRSQVVNSMHQRGTEGETQDGMDISFCIIDLEKNNIQFSGAFNPLFIVRDDELLEFKGDKMPIGVHVRQHQPFSNHDVEIKKNDILYIFSDGYVDQFGGPNRKKFLIKRFRELLLTISKKPMSDQKLALENTIDEWMGPYDQIDDILVFGAKII